MTAAEPSNPSQPCIVAGFENSPSGFDAVALGRLFAAATDAHLIVAHIYLDAASAIDIVPLPELVAERRKPRRHQSGAVHLRATSAPLRKGAVQGRREPRYVGLSVDEEVE